MVVFQLGFLLAGDCVGVSSDRPGRVSAVGGNPPRAKIAGARVDDVATLEPIEMIRFTLATRIL